MKAERPNILLITADDMNWDAVGAFGCPVPGTTPNIDRLASEGMRFQHGHVTIAVCQPSRSAMMTGLYPHRSGGEGFFRLRYRGVPILPQILRDAGYRVGILGKLAHSTPHEYFRWGTAVDFRDLGYGRNPGIYAGHAERFIGEASKAGTPFFLMANSHDPHRPFYGNDREEWYREGDLPAASIPSRIFDPEEITTPDFLWDLPEVRLEISEYYNSVRRCDDTVGRLLDVLDGAGAAENTLILFLSDNGMAFPFAKTNCYLNSTRTPWIMRWPGVMPAGVVDREHFVSGIDILPTLLDAAGADIPPDIDGRSFIPLIRGGGQEGREVVFTQFHQTALRRNYPMRCVQDERFGYIWNSWSDGQRIFRNESQSGRTFPAMESAPDAAGRVRMFLYRVPEELYDFKSDPAALNNLAEDPRFSEELGRLRGLLEDWMIRTGDPALAAFRYRGSARAQERYLRDIGRIIGENLDYT